MHHVGFPEVGNSASHSTCTFDWPDAKRTHQKVFKKISKCSQELIKNLVGWPQFGALYLL